MSHWKLFREILDIVFTEKVREEAGGTYGVSLNIGSQKFPVQEATDLIMFDASCKSQWSESNYLQGAR